MRIDTALTKKQKRVLDAIAKFIEQKGYAPTYKEIGKLVGLTSIATVHKYITVLERKGRLARGPWNRPRTVKLLGKKFEAVVLPKKNPDRISALRNLLWMAAVEEAVKNGTAREFNGHRLLPEAHPLNRLMADWTPGLP